MFLGPHGGFGAIAAAGFRHKSIMRRASPRDTTADTC